MSHMTCLLSEAGGAMTEHRTYTCAYTEHCCVCAWGLQMTKVRSKSHFQLQMTLLVWRKTWIQVTLCVRLPWDDTITTPNFTQRWNHNRRSLRKPVHRWRCRVICLCPCLGLKRYSSFSCLDTQKANSFRIIIIKKQTKTTNNNNNMKMLPYT